MSLHISNSDNQSEPVNVRLSEVISALSYALDLVEGQPEGHAVRSCMLGMRLAEEIGLPTDQRSSLYYALLLKDLGCSSNAAKVCYLFGADDIQVKRDFKTTHWTRYTDTLRYISRNVSPHWLIVRQSTPSDRPSNLRSTRSKGSCKNSM